jgi:sporulation protein YlmC with PRC-barrel domain
MELLFGNLVFELGHRLGRLAGIEVDPKAGRALKIVVSRDGRLGAHAVTRPIEVVRADGARVLIAQVPPPSPPMPFRLEPVLWSQGTHVVRGHVEIGRPIGVRLEEVTGRLQAIVVRKGRWGRIQELTMEGIDLSVLGELRVGGDSRAA